MRTETIFAVVSTTTAPIEITQEKLNLIIKKREKNTHTTKRNSYINKINELLTQTKDDGFTFAIENIRTMHKAKP